MKSRKHLRDAIRRAWTSAIKTDYARQRINSERSLQASFWSKLNRILPAETRRMFIEPSMSAGSKVRYPDIVICNTQRVIGIIEMKYQPKVKPSWEKDLETIHWVMDHREDIIVSNRRHRGMDVDSKKYPLAKDILLVWAGVHRPVDWWLSDHIERGEISDLFFEIHAETQDNGHPTVEWNPA